jgi:glycosyltransferase involved in cell wall biosynthesis
MLNIVERLDRARYQPAVCVSKPGGDLCWEVERLGIPLLVSPFTVGAQPYGSLLRRAWRAAGPFRERRFVLWHSFHYLDDYTEGIVARMAGAGAWIYTKKNMNWHRRSWRLRTLLARRVAAQNTAMMREFFGCWPWRKRARLIPRGVDPVKFRPQGEPRLELRRKLRLPGEAVLAVSVGHLVPVKGHPALLRAAADCAGLHVVLAGRAADQQYAASLHQLSRELRTEDRVHFLGEVKDIPALLAEADIFVFPTTPKGEGCPVALLEAMSCGLACVATRIPGSEDVIEHESSGLLVPPEQEATLAEAIRRLMVSADMRARLGAGARQRILTRYTIDHEVRLHDAMYSEILGAA